MFLDQKRVICFCCKSITEILFLSGYNFKIEFVKSEKHVNADVLSCLPLKIEHGNSRQELDWIGTYLHHVNESSLPITFEDIKTETQKDLILRQIFNYVMYGWLNYVPSENAELNTYFKRKEELTIEQGIICENIKSLFQIDLINMYYMNYT